MLKVGSCGQLQARRALQCPYVQCSPALEPHCDPPHRLAPFPFANAPFGHPQGLDPPCLLLVLRLLLRLAFPFRAPFAQHGPRVRLPAQHPEPADLLGARHVLARVRRLVSAVCALQLPHALVLLSIDQHRFPNRTSCSRATGIPGSRPCGPGSQQRLLTSLVWCRHS